LTGKGTFPESQDLTGLLGSGENAGEAHPNPRKIRTGSCVPCFATREKERHRAKIGPNGLRGYRRPLSTQKKERVRKCPKGKNPPRAKLPKKRRVEKSLGGPLANGTGKRGKNAGTSRK